MSKVSGNNNRVTFVQFPFIVYLEIRRNSLLSKTFFDLIMKFTCLNYLKPNKLSQRYVYWWMFSNKDIICLETKQRLTFCLKLK